MQTVRVYDPARRPASWKALIGPTQFVAFPSDAATGAICDADGARLAADEAVCLIFDSLDEARAWSRERVAAQPRLRLDVFDAAGRVRPPLDTVVHPSRAASLEGNRRGRRWMVASAIVLILLAPVLFWYDWALHEGVLIMPTLLGINCLLVAGRLIQLSLAYASAEKAQRDRLARG